MGFSTQGIAYGISAVLCGALAIICILEAFSLAPSRAKKRIILIGIGILIIALYLGYRPWEFYAALVNEDMQGIRIETAPVLDTQEESSTKSREKE